MTTERELLAIEHQLVSDRLIAELLKCVYALTAERDSYRELAIAGIDALHTLTTKHDRLLTVQRALRDELRERRQRALDDEETWSPAGSADVFTSAGAGQLA